MRGGGGGDPPLAVDDKGGGEEVMPPTSHAPDPEVEELPFKWSSFIMKDHTNSINI